MPSRSRGQSPPALPRPRTELRRLRAQVARLDQLTRVQALALAHLTGSCAATPADATIRDAAFARALLEVLAARDPEIRAHGERVALHAVALASALDCSTPLCDRVRLAGLLHDLGKISLSDGVLHRPGAVLAARDWTALRRHPEVGAQILSALEGLADVALYVRHHHEWFDGSARGYPDRLQADQIPLPSRILAVADAIDAVPARPTRPMQGSCDEVTAALRELSGRRLDPQLVAAASTLLERRAQARLQGALHLVGGRGQ